jgi:PPOX class probable F420-dependent enzyme
VSQIDLGKARERLDDDLVGWLTTVTPSGQPQTSIVWFLRQGTDLLIYSRPNTGKLANLAANPRVAFTLRSDEAGHTVFTMEGTAVVDDSPTLANEIPEYVEKYRDLIAENRWTPKSFAEDYSVLIKVTITRVRRY